jgi:hypothetical protein
MSVDGSLWYVKLADGDVERVTLDQLDEAFQNGQIDENTMVLAAGSDQWLKLSDLLGLADATPPPPPPTPAPQGFTRAPVAQPQYFQPPAPIAMRPPSAAIPAMQPRPMMRPPVAMPVMSGAVSVRPVTFDLGNQFDAGDVSYPKRSRKGLVVGFFGTAAVLGGAAFFVATRAAHSTSASDATPVFAAAIAPPAAPPAPPPMQVTPAPPSNPQGAMPGPSPVMDPTQRLSDDQKQRLLEAEKKSKSHAKSHGGGGSGGGGTATASRSKSSSATFTTTGSKYDPLNSSM